VQSFPRAKKFRNKFFPLFEALGELHDDFSIKNCITVLNTLEVTKEEKIKAYKVFKDSDNRHIFLSAYNDDREVALMWLRDEMA
jgi:hypothetical protein